MSHGVYQHGVYQKDGITFRNDCKGKHQSYTAWIRSDGAGLNAHYEYNVYGYGATEEEALTNLKQMLKSMKSSISAY